jgi:hypothetical protein
MKDLKIEPDYLAYLEANGLTKDIEYFRAKNLINDARTPPPSATAGANKAAGTEGDGQHV